MSAVPHHEPDTLTNQRLFESQVENKITVPGRIARYHPFVRAALRARTDDQRRTWSRGPRLDVQVSASSLTRAKRLMHTLIGALGRRDFPLRVDEQKGTFVSVHGIDIQIQLSEKNKRVDLAPKHPNWSPWRNFELRPTGRLNLQIVTHYGEGLQKSWVDGRRQRVEDRLNDFVVGLVAVAESEREREREWAERRAQWAEEEGVAEAQRRTVEEERLRGEQLTADARAWEAAERIRGYVAALETRAGPQPPDSVAAWLEWARAYAASIDPTVREMPRLPPRTDQSSSPPQKR